MPVPPVGEGDQKPGVGYCLHFLEKPLREERLEAPVAEPARRRKACLSCARLFSICSRTICPCGRPVRREDSSSHSASSLGRRTVIVLLIIHHRNTQSHNALWAGALPCRRASARRFK